MRLGRYTVKPDIQIQEKIVEKVVEKEVVKTVDNTKTSDSKNSENVANKHIHKVVTIVKKPDGTETTTISYESDENKQEKTVEVKYVDRFVTVDKIVEKVVEKQVEVTKTTTYSKPQWTVSANIGINLNNVSVPVVGAEVDRRIFGPFFAGAWILTDTQLQTKTIGTSLKFEF